MDICTYNALIIILILKDVTDYRHKERKCGYHKG